MALDCLYAVGGFRLAGISDLDVREITNRLILLYLTLLKYSIPCHMSVLNQSFTTTVSGADFSIGSQHFFAVENKEWS